MTFCVRSDRRVPFRRGDRRRITVFMKTKPRIHEGYFGGTHLRVEVAADEKSARFFHRTREGWFVVESCELTPSGRPRGPYRMADCYRRLLADAIAIERGEVTYTYFNRRTGRTRAAA